MWINCRYVKVWQWCVCNTRFVAVSLLTFRIQPSEFFISFLGSAFLSLVAWLNRGIFCRLISYITDWNKLNYKLVYTVFCFLETELFRTLVPLTCLRLSYFSSIVVSFCPLFVLFGQVPRRLDHIRRCLLSVSLSLYQSWWLDVWSCTSGPSLCWHRSQPP